MSRLDKYIRKTVVEKGEYVRDVSGNVSKITESPTHNDKILVDGNKVKNVPSGKGGVSLSNVESVVSATHENRKQKDKLYTQKDENIKILPDEAKDFSLGIGLKINVPKKGISPAKLIDLNIEALTSFKKKFNGKEYKQDDYSLNTASANEATLNALPELEDIYDAVLNLQESKKPQEDLEYAQRGKSPTLYVDSVNDPRYRAYRDSLNLYNYPKRVQKEATDKDFLNKARKDWFSSNKEKRDYTFGNFGIASDGDYYLLGSEKENNKLKNLINKTGNLPIGRYALEGEVPIFKYPRQKVEVDPRLRFPKVSSITNDIGYSLNPSINIPEINEQLEFDPGTYEGYQREVGSEYRRNPQGGYGEYNHRWSGGKWNRTPRQTGGISYDQWKDKYSLVETSDYNLKRAYELGYIPDEQNHLPSIDNKTLKFLKKSDHPTINKELEWFNSKEGKPFRKHYSVDSTSNKDWWQYVPKKKQTGGYAQGGFFDRKVEELIPSTTDDRSYKEMIYNRIRPSDYYDKDNYINLALGRNRTKWDDVRSEEAFKQYLGLNDSPKYLRQSQYLPSRRSSDDVTYYSVDPELEADIYNSFRDIDIPENSTLKTNEFNVNSKFPEGTKFNKEGYVILNEGDSDRRMMKSRARMLGDFSVSRGSDERGSYISYYDKYDFPKKYQRFLKGNPYEIYGRIYDSDMKQTGGQKGVIQRYPHMNGNRPTARVQLNDGRLVPIEYLDDRTISMDDLFYADSVYVDRNKAKTFYDRKNKTFIKK